MKNLVQKRFKDILVLTYCFTMQNWQANQMKHTEVLSFLHTLTLQRYQSRKFLNISGIWLSLLFLSLNLLVTKNGLLNTKCLPKIFFFFFWLCQFSKASAWSIPFWNWNYQKELPLRFDVRILVTGWSNKKNRSRLTKLYFQKFY